MLGKIRVQVILEKSVSQQNVYTDVLQQNLIWKLKLIGIVFKDSVHTAQKTQCTFIRKTNWLMLYRDTIYCLLYESYEICTLYGQHAAFCILKSSITYGNPKDL
jgi:hypothetical protein